MLNHTFEYALTSMVEGRKALKVCMLLQNIPILAATYSFRNNKAKTRLHHEAFIRMPQDTKREYLGELDEAAKSLPEKLAEDAKIS